MSKRKIIIYITILSIIFIGCIIQIVNSLIYNFKSNIFEEFVNEIKQINDEVIIYTSSDKKSIIIEDKNFTSNRYKFVEKAKLKLKSYLDKQEFKSYTKLLIKNKMLIDNKNYIVDTVFSLPSMQQIINEEKIYVVNNDKKEEQTFLGNNNIENITNEDHQKVSQNTINEITTKENESSSKKKETTPVKTTTTKNTETANNNEEMTWVGDTGTKYHRKTCRTLKGNGHQITMKRALSEGRTACKVCKP